jgi:hypothetical protein
MLTAGEMVLSGIQQRRLFNLLDTSHGAPASGPGKTYVLENHQHFPHPPTSDGHREARMALNALQVQFDG